MGGPEAGSLFVASQLKRTIEKSNRVHQISSNQWHELSVLDATLALLQEANILNNFYIKQEMQKCINIIQRK